MRLYHFCLRSHIEAIGRDGFRDGDVWLSDISLLDDSDDAMDDCAQVVIEAPDDVIAAFVVTDNPIAGDGYREYLVPAALVNAWPRRVRGQRRT